MPITAGFYFAEANLTKVPRVPILLIHGAGSDHLCWPGEIRRLPGERTLALDLPGHGRSSGLSEQSVSRYAEQVLKFLDVLGVYRAVLVGHSLGGAIALWTALKHPKRTPAAGLIASGACFKVPSGLLESLSSAVTLPAALNLLQSHLFGKRASKSLVEKTMSSFKKARPSQLQSDWKAAANFDLCEQLSGIHVPVWIAVGEEDSLTPPAMGHYLARHLPKGQLFKVAEAGHMLMLEQPQKVGEELGRFLKSLPLNYV